MSKESEIVMDQRGTETILIAEDEPGIRDLVTIILTEQGYGVISAADGEEAISKFIENKEHVALVMLDAMMPKKNGKEVFLEIMRQKPEMKVIFMSGYSDNMLDLDEIKGGRVHFLQKPVLPSSILKKVRDALDDKSTG